MATKKATTPKAPKTSKAAAAAEILVAAPVQTFTPAEERFYGIVKEAHDKVTEIKPCMDGWAPWSMSKMKCLSKCPFQFYLKYVLKVKVPGEIAEKDDPLSSNVGSAAHRILEVGLLGKTLAESYAVAKKEFVSELLTETEWDDHVVKLESNIQAFFERIQSLERRHPVQRVLTELRMGVTRDWQAAGFFADDVWYRGVIDLIIMLKNGDVIIIDHKTGGGEGGTKYYEDQLDSYKVLFHHGISPINGAQSGIHFIAAGDVKMAGFSNKVEIETKLRNHMEWNLANTVDKVEELGYMKHVRGGPCKWCDFDKLGCKSGKLKDIELDTKKFFKITPV